MLGRDEDEYRRREGAEDDVVDSVVAVAVVAVAEHAVNFRDVTESRIQKETKHDEVRIGKRRGEQREGQPSRLRYRVNGPQFARMELNSFAVKSLDHLAHDVESTPTPKI